MRRWFGIFCFGLVVTLLTSCPINNDNNRKVVLEWNVPVKSTDDYNIKFGKFLQLNTDNGKYHLGEDWNRIPRSGEDGDVDFGDSIFAPAYGRVYSIHSTEDKDS